MIRWRHILNHNTIYEIKNPIVLITNRQKYLIFCYGEKLRPDS